ncbi:hypothetical protein AAZV13_08G159000 [Glycine max]
MKNSNSDIASICLQGLGDKFLFFSICFREVTLEAKSNKLVGWTCNICSDMVPYMHVHKVILLSGCDYLKGLLWSGMQESHSEVIKVDISWEALIKLVQWFYSDDLPNPPSGCMWDNMDDEEKLFNLHHMWSFVDLLSSGFWKIFRKPAGM